MKNNYVLMGQIRVTYKFEAIAFPQSDKIEMFFAADDKLLEVKNRLDKLLGHNFYFFLNQSFMPSFDAKIGDLAKCYGRMDSETKRYEIKLTAC